MSKLLVIRAHPSTTPDSPSARVYPVLPAHFQALEVTPSQHLHLPVRHRRPRRSKSSRLGVTLAQCLSRSPTTTTTFPRQAGRPPAAHKHLQWPAPTVASEQKRVLPRPSPDPPISHDRGPASPLPPHPSPLVPPNPSPIVLRLRSPFDRLPELALQKHRRSPSL